MPRRHFSGIHNIQKTFITNLIHKIQKTSFRHPQHTENIHQKSNQLCTKDKFKKSVTFTFKKRTKEIFQASTTHRKHLSQIQSITFTFKRRTKTSFRQRRVCFYLRIDNIAAPSTVFILFQNLLKETMK